MAETLITARDEIRVPHFSVEKTVGALCVAL